MPQWIHDRAEHILAKNPSMPKGEAFALATQQAHAVGKSPKGYGTAEGRHEAKAKYDTPKDDKKTANPGSLESPKMDKKAEEKKFKLQGHLEHQGLPIAVENRKGSVRKGVDKDGKPWRTEMKFPYGYIKGTKGADGEEVDAYVGPVKDAPVAYVVHQHKENGKGFDEDKVMLGFASKKDAEKGFLAHYDDPKFLGPISEVPVETLKELVESGKELKKISSLFDELAKLGAVSEEQARQALERYDALERSKPTLGQVGRYAGIGALAAPAIGAVGDVVSGKPVFGGGSAGEMLRGAAGRAVTGALSASAIPILRQHFDRRAEMGTLKDYLANVEPERSRATAGALQPPFEPAETSAGGVSKLSAVEDVSGRKEKDSAASGVTPAKSWDGHAVLASLVKQAFETSQYSAGLGPPSSPQVSQLPTFKKPNLGGVLQKSASPELEQVKKEHAVLSWLGDHPKTMALLGSATNGPLGYLIAKDELGAGPLGRAGLATLGAVSGGLTGAGLSLNTRGSLERMAKARAKEKSAAGAPTRGNFMMASEVPPFRAPSLQSPVQKLSELDEEKQASTAITPVGRMSAAMRVGLPKVTAPPGPSIAQVAKPVGFGKPAAGAKKTTI